MRRTAWIGWSFLAFALGSTVVLSTVMRNLGSTDCRRERSDFIAIECALEKYAEIHAGAHPTSLDELVRPDGFGQTLLNGPRLPRDPWGRPYRYEPPDAEFDFPRIWSCGKDGLPGGTGDDAEIGNWMWRD